MHISKLKDKQYTLRGAYDALIGRLDARGIKHSQSLSLDSRGFGHGWIKYLRMDRKAGMIFLCSHDDNMDPECCYPIYRFIRVYAYNDDVKDDNWLGDVAIYSSETIEGKEKMPSQTPEQWMSTWQDNVSYYKQQSIGKTLSGTDYVDNYVYNIYIKDPISGASAMNPYTTYPSTLEQLLDYTTTSGAQAYSGVHVDKSNMTCSFVDSAGNEGTFFLKDSCSAKDKLYYVWCDTDKQLFYYKSESNPSFSAIADTFYTGEFFPCPVCLGVQTCFCCTDSNLYNGYRLNCNNLAHVYEKTLTNIQTMSWKPKDTQIQNGIIKDQLKYFFNTSAMYNNIEYRDGKYTSIFKISKDASTTARQDVVADAVCEFEGNPYSAADAIVRFTNASYNDEFGIEVDLPDFVGLEFSGASAIPPTSAFSAYDNSMLGPYKTPKFFILDNDGEVKEVAAIWDHGELANNPAQVLNSETHCKTKTFDFEDWDYDKIMNFVLYKDNNLTMTPASDDLQYYTSREYIDYNVTESDWTPSFSSMCGRNIAYCAGMIDGVNRQEVCWKTYGSNDSYKLKNYGSESESDILILKNYNPMTSKKQKIIPLFTIYDNLEGTDWNYNRGYAKNYHADQSYPMYEGIFGSYDDHGKLYDTYAWMHCRNNYLYDYDTNIYKKLDNQQALYTGVPETYEMHQDFKDNTQYIMLMSKQPIKSIYVKETFKSGNSGCGNGQNVKSLPMSVSLSDASASYKLAGVSAFRHVCPTCSGYHVCGIQGCSSNNGVVSAAASTNRLYTDKKHNGNESIKYYDRCPTCAGCGVRMRYQYFDYDLLTSGTTPVRTTASNSIAEMKKELLYVISGTLFDYWQGVSAVSSDADGYKHDYIAWSPCEYGYNGMYSYTTIDSEKDADGKQIIPVKPILDVSALDVTKLYRTEKDIDDVIYTSAYFPIYNNRAGGYVRVYFDKEMLRKDYIDNNGKKLSDFCRIHMTKYDLDHADHWHDADDDNGLMKKDMAEPFSAKHNYLNPHSATDSMLYITCPVCNGTSAIQVQETDEYGDPVYDFYDNPVYVSAVCYTCNGTGHLLSNELDRYEMVDCEYCGGVGTVTSGTETVTCPICRGKGKAAGSSTTRHVGPDTSVVDVVYKYNTQHPLSADNLMIEMEMENMEYDKETGHD